MGRPRWNNNNKNKKNDDQEDTLITSAVWNAADDVSRGLSREPSVHYALMDAHAQIDQTHTLQTSRRFFYKAEKERAESFTFLSNSISTRRGLSLQDLEALQEDADDDDNEDDNDDAVEAEKAEAPREGVETLARSVSEEYMENVGEENHGEQAMTEFFASEGNIELLQQDLAEAEALFFERYGGLDAAGSSKNLEDAAAAPAATKIQLFNPLHYDNVEHQWQDKPFVKEFMLTFFGTIRQERMEQIVTATRTRLLATEGAWDSEGLVLANVGRLFGCQLFFPISNPQALEENQSTTTSATSTTSPTSSPQAQAAPPFQITYLSGVWLSKVYVGVYHNQFNDWVENVILYVKHQYGRDVTPHDQNWFVYYPTALEQPLAVEGESMVVFFIQVSDYVEI